MRGSMAAVTHEATHHVQASENLALSIVIAAPFDHGTNFVRGSDISPIHVEFSFWRYSSETGPIWSSSFAAVVCLGMY